MDIFQDYNHFGLEIDQEICNSFNLEMLNDNDADYSSSKEITGRWTREEHLTFIKGLEMYGKGWKKIAGLIKTRTVVQIRTHAQKYFLKLSKARQNGDSSGALSVDGKSGFCNGLRKKKIRRKRDKPISLSKPLQHFLQVVDPLDPNPNLDIDSTLYNFLSPRIGTTAHPPVLITKQPDAPTITEDDDDAHNVTKIVTQTTTVSNNTTTIVPIDSFNQEEKSADEQTTTTVNIVDESTRISSPIVALDLHPTASFTSGVELMERLILSESDRTLPEWYSNCEHIASLLNRAESLNWAVDTFVPINIPPPPPQVLQAVLSSHSSMNKVASTTLLPSFNEDDHSKLEVNSNNVLVKKLSTSNLTEHNNIYNNTNSTAKAISRCNLTGGTPRSNSIDEGGITDNEADSQSRKKHRCSVTSIADNGCDSDDTDNHSLQQQQPPPPLSLQSISSTNEKKKIQSSTNNNHNTNAVPTTSKYLKQQAEEAISCHGINDDDDDEFLKNPITF